MKKNQTAINCNFGLIVVIYLNITSFKFNKYISKSITVLNKTSYYLKKKLLRIFCAFNEEL